MATTRALWFAELLVLVCSLDPSIQDGFQVTHSSSLLYSELGLEPQHEHECECNKTNNTDGTGSGENMADLAVGTTLALIGGTLYAIGALMVSWTSRAKESDPPAITEKCGKIMAFVSWSTMNIGGLCVTFAYESGASIPLLNAFVYSTNLFLNMLLQILGGLSRYTKNMRCGTILFAVVAVQLGSMAPPPREFSLSLATEYISSTGGIVWFTCFFAMWIASTCVIRQMGEAPRSSPVKIMVWAIHVACWGSFTDNWAKMNGALRKEYFDMDKNPDQYQPAIYWASFIPYLLTGALTMVLSVMAFAATEVAIYVPANLCFQLVFNTGCAFVVWNESAVFATSEAMIAYLLGFVICLMSVYMASEELDLSASFSQSREIGAKALSKGEAVTPFGRSLITLSDDWKAATTNQESDAIELRKEKIATVMREGALAKAISKDKLVDLILRMWQKVSSGYLPFEAVAQWFHDVEYFQEYFKQDPLFKVALLGPDEITKPVVEKRPDDSTKPVVEMASQS